MAKHRWLAGLLAGVVLIAPAASRAGPDADASVVHAWNDVLQSNVPPTAGPFSGRFYALVHMAQAEAVNSIERRYTPFFASVTASNGASTKAAAAKAARDVLAVLVPAGTASYDALLASQLAGIPPGLASQGLAVGAAAAKQVLAFAATDGFNVPDTTTKLPEIAGNYQGASGFTRSLGMRPISLTSRTQFLPKRYPELDSAAYAKSLNEVQAYGGETGSLRNEQQTLQAKLWAGVVTRTSPFVVWNNAARQLATGARLDLLDTARVLALMNVSMQDGLLTTQSAKWLYGLWRPQTAIRNADKDLNAETAVDGSWKALVPIPPYPSYPGNMACIGAAGARALTLAFGTDSVSITVLWRGNTVNGVTNPDVTQHFTSLAALAQAEADARVYGGLHFRFDNEASQELCPKVTDWVFEHHLRARRD